MYSYLASGGHFKRLHYHFRLGDSIIGKVVSDVCCAICDILSST